MSILLASRYGSRGGALAWILLTVGSLASLGANVAVAEPSVIGRVIAAWPSAALIGSYELLISQIRRVFSDTASEEPAVAGDENEEQAEPPVEGRARLRDHGIVDLHRAAWRWAQSNRLPDGLPSGKAIASQFERSARWGRLIKKAGLAGELG
ncbi:hypothetical protein Sme01_38330 [Sphaerisporangium melleum]|uniref:Uncharacterized protein n=1 Tax=Sphaerisporangium melleum TaxID=321316 RepID=A0A917R1M1_9ACTN|nr:hypothetical protein [Sphaerisporangium melleum]GGK82255.1 hypothetical protein GCM10007964_26160 [Sphaerisporangium melleum]GII71357.1 hypothetical protein Sme01_38330 [Sphaerisporangium melleum]